MYVDNIVCLPNTYLTHHQNNFQIIVFIANSVAVNSFITIPVMYLLYYTKRIRYNLNVRIKNNKLLKFYF